MKKFFQLAWRNLWRSRTRTILTSTVILFVVIFSSMMSSQQYGIYDKMISNITDFSGHIQIQDSVFKETSNINYAFEQNQGMMSKLDSHENITGVVPRLEIFSLASYKDHSKGVMVQGVNPQREKDAAGFDEKLVQYRVSDESLKQLQDSSIIKTLQEIKGKSYISEAHLNEDLKHYFPKTELAAFTRFKNESRINSQYLEEGNRGVLIGDKLAKYLKISIGDTLVMIGQGYHGLSAAGLFPVRGIIKFPIPELERRLVVMDLSVCQEYASANNLLTSILIRLDKNDHLTKAQNDLADWAPKNLSVNTWEELQPETLQMIESDKASGVFMKAVFYMIVGFIIFGTVMMMMTERKREFGILISIGMHKWVLSLVLFFETLLISLMGALSGLALSYPILTLLHRNPIPLRGDMVEMMEEFGFEPVLYFANDAHIFFRQALVIFIIAMVIFIFPLINIIRLNIVKAIRG